MVPRTSIYWNIVNILQTRHYKAEQNELNWELCFVQYCRRHQHKQQTMRVDNSKKLVHFLEIEIIEASISKTQILSAIQALKATPYATHLKIMIELSRVTTIAMINSGATGNFICKEFVKKNGMPKVKKDDLYQLMIQDKITLRQDEGMVNTKTQLLRCPNGGKDQKWAAFNLVSIQLDITLVMPGWKKMS